MRGQKPANNFFCRNQNPCRLENNSCRNQNPKPPEQKYKTLQENQNKPCEVLIWGGFD